ncbi:efflux RND transporter periplasmic adaptor subunit [Massilia antarctica]|uniref:efflux RND transporter periplasmic adaptor subunit n=1 Tax=Massilia antarctica TaxID=2765360 RepID=UPI0006BB93C5|nr:efflux RND transporter periplasmic adaptor subunit [Massilia sp. H27-R4]MCY0910996.1 efflux RND transporter periplasmic adaptor subunit [Massilia sp. H27-R4]CUI09792.1 Probable Co/Zn/Cd efflux system membrane fusion protein [Janthinobacterium sp. CG23_2]CUU33578.1 Probable Co/Zn/Cd efflux system membrane fusion protein [Janthinobacterium sp. CG23_2]
MKLETLPSAPAQPTLRKPRWRAPALGVLIVALGAGAWFALQARQPAAASAPTAQGPEAKKAPPVYELARADVAAIAAGELSINMPLSGSLAPLTQATVKSKVSGQVLETSAQEGMNVAAGQVLARLDQADQQARLAQQQAALDEANARLSMAAKNNANSAALLAQKFISQNAYDTTENSVALARASVRAAQAQVELARIAVNDTLIRAPLAGVVSKRHVQAGDKLSPDMPAFSIVNLQQLTLEAQVPASDIPRVKAGQEVRFRVDGYPSRTFLGKVARINPTTETGSRGMLVYISVDNADSALRGGMFAKGSITTEKSASHPLLPVAALRKDKEIDVVYVVEAGKVVSRPVTLGLRNDDEGMVEVTGGLEHGARVITARLDAVKPGSQVKLSEPAAKVSAVPAAPAAPKG